MRAPGNRLQQSQHGSRNFEKVSAGSPPLHGATHHELHEAKRNCALEASSKSFKKGCKHNSHFGSHFFDSQNGSKLFVSITFIIATARIPILRVVFRLQKWELIFQSFLHSFSPKNKHLPAHSNKKQNLSDSRLYFFEYLLSPQEADSFSTPKTMTVPIISHHITDLK